MDFLLCIKENYLNGLDNQVDMAFVDMMYGYILAYVRVAAGFGIF
jgi:hypothetical protein